MTPLHIGIAALAALGLGWAVKNDKFDGLLGKKEGTLALKPGAPAEKLEKGRTYTVLAVITKDITQDSRWSALQGPNEDKIAQLIASTFAQSGFKVLNKPTIRDGFEMQKAYAQQPSTWVFNAQWLMDGDHVTAVIPWMAGASFYLVPTA